MNKTVEKFEALIQILNELREKCPWDKKQTIYTLRTMTIEETYELTEEISKQNWDGIKEELGDLLLHILFYSKIAAENKKFTLEEVITTISDKLIKRHPHIYGNVVVNNEEDVKRNWEKIKLSEGKKSVLSGVPTQLPSLIKATRIQEKVSQIGFEWNNIEDVWQKVNEETDELQQAVCNNNPEQIEEEFGDVIFSLINYARFLHIDPESTLDKANKKFINRFTEMEKIVSGEHRKLTDLTLTEMNEIWNRIKEEKIIS